MIHFLEFAKYQDGFAPDEKRRKEWETMNWEMFINWGMSLLENRYRGNFQGRSDYMDRSRRLAFLFNEMANLLYG